MHFILMILCMLNQRFANSLRMMDKPKSAARSWWELICGAKEDGFKSYKLDKLDWKDRDEEKKGTAPLFKDFE